MNIGYARVSTSDQDTALQLDALHVAGVQRVYSEHGSGVGPRPQLHRALRRLRTGDVLVVWKIDRMARSLPDLLRILEKLKDCGAGLRSLTEPIDTSTPMGEFVLQVLGAVAQLERAMIRERVIAGQVAFVKRGGVFGRPKLLTPEQETDVIKKVNAGETMSSVARSYNVSLIVVRRILDEAEGRYNTGKMPVLRKFLQ